MPCGYDVGKQRRLERSERLRFPADEARRIVAKALAPERHLRINEIDLAALECADAGFADAGQQRERKDFVKILAETEPIVLCRRGHDTKRTTDLATS